MITSMPEPTEKITLLLPTEAVARAATEAARQGKTLEVFLTEKTRFILASQPLGDVEKDEPAAE